MTRANDRHPTRRIVETDDGDFVLEVSARTLRLRPKGTHRGGRAEVEATWSALYLRSMWARVESERRDKKRARKERRKLK